MKKTVMRTGILLTAVLFFAGLRLTAQPMYEAGSYNFFVVSDLDRGGRYDQPVVARQMIRLAEKVDPRFIVLAGDCFHGSGVTGVDDPLWTKRFENIYPKQSLPMPWYPIIGNHEYRGNSQALVDYAAVSSRWKMEGRYYVKDFTTDGGVTLRIVLIDTPPFVARYRTHADYPQQIREQDTEAQLQWLEKALSESTAHWTLVVGHHPVYSVDDKHGSTKELIRQVDPLLRAHGVDAYISGHIHNFQHLQVDGFDYIVNTSGGEGRPSQGDERTRFHAGTAGFTVCTVTPENLAIQFVDPDGKVIYTYEKNK